MATTKNAITQKMAIAIVRDYVKNYPDEFVEIVETANEDASVDDLVEVLDNMFNKLNRTRKSGNSKKREENLALLDLITPFMKTPQTAGSVYVEFDEIASVPKATAILKLGVETGKLVRLEKTKKSESFQYMLAEDENDIDAD